MALVALATLDSAVRVTIQRGIVAVCYPFRLHRKPWVVAGKIHHPHVQPGLVNALHFYLDERTCLRLPCWGLSAAVVACIKAEIAKAE